jgi:translation initiation factor 2 subunit 3
MSDKDTKMLDILNVGLVGHIDHGKTTLLQRLSGKWTDTHSEELKRGITIKLGYADTVIYSDKGVYNIEGKGTRVREVSFVDAPGHEMLMATMLSGAALIDVALLIIAANEGIKPQTKEHVMALQAKGIKDVIVVQNKIDLLTEKEVAKNYKEIMDFLRGKFDNAPVIPVSAQQSVNIDVLWRLLCEIKLSARKLDCEPEFLVARSFDVNRPGVKPEELHGAVLGGTLKCGKLKVGDEIEIKPGRVVKEANQFRYDTLKTRILGLFRGSREIKELNPGGSTSIATELDMAFGKGDALSGNVVSLSGKLPELTESVKLKYKLFSEIGASELKPSEVILLSINTSTTGGAVGKLGKGEVEVALKKPVVAFKGDNVGIARNVNGHWRLIGSGEIL